MELFYRGDKKKVEIYLKRILATFLDKSIMFTTIILYKNNRFTI